MPFFFFFAQYHLINKSYVYFSNSSFFFMYYGIYDFLLCSLTYSCSDCFHTLEIIFFWSLAMSVELPKMMANLVSCLIAR